MEVLDLEEKDTSSFVQSKNTEQTAQVSTIFSKHPDRMFSLGFEDLIKFSDILNLCWTSIKTSEEESLCELDEDNTLGYYTDNYDIAVTVPVKKSYKVKVKIRSVTRAKPQVFLDADEL